MRDTRGLLGAGGSSSDGGTKKPIVKLLVQNGLRSGAIPPWCVSRGTLLYVSALKPWQLASLTAADRATERHRAALYLRASITFCIRPADDPLSANELTSCIRGASPHPSPGVTAVATGAVIGIFFPSAFAPLM